jgi:hypothetical protein
MFQFKPGDIVPNDNALEQGCWMFEGHKMCDKMPFMGGIK